MLFRIRNNPKKDENADFRAKITAAKHSSITKKLKYNKKQKNTTMSELFQTPLDKVIERGKIETSNTKITI
jgi:hypothetical protein